jgi:hypothetical protein
LKEGFMKRPHTYSWQIEYKSALLETDHNQVRSRIYAAIAALEQRRLSPVGRDENRVLTAAEAGLQQLITDRADS